jgi:hypothetical protein
LNFILLKCGPWLIPKRERWKEQNPKSIKTETRKGDVSMGTRNRNSFILQEGIPEPGAEEFYYGRRIVPIPRMVFLNDIDKLSALGKGVILREAPSANPVENNVPPLWWALRANGLTRWDLEELERLYAEDLGAEVGSNNFRVLQDNVLVTPYSPNGKSVSSLIEVKPTGQIFPKPLSWLMGLQEGDCVQWGIDAENRLLLIEGINDMTDLQRYRNLMNWFRTLEKHPPKDMIPIERYGNVGVQAKSYLGAFAFGEQTLRHRHGN